MDVSPLDPDSRGQTDNFPLLMERPENHNDPEHVIDIARGSDASLSNSSHSDYHDAHDAHDAEPAQPAGRPSSTARPTNYQSNLSNSSSVRRGDEYGRRRRSPLNSGLWISIELVVIISQIITAIVVLSLSRHENPQAPLFAWIVGYAAGCVATLPILYLRYCHRNQNMEQESTQSRAQSNPAAEPAPYTAISVSRTSEDTLRTARTGHNMRALSARLNVLTDHYKMALDCFFAVWFVVGNVWIFGGHSSSSEAPNLYRLCIVFLTISCIGYAMPFILCATICCCLPCIISILGFREDLSHTRGATPESISALPTYKFKVKKNGAESNGELDSDGVAEGGVVAAGTEKERSISAEDAVCCICLARYADNDELRELPCAHFFHMECVDKWLKINALCPLCKCEVGECSEASPSVENSSQNHGERVPNRAAGGETYGSTVF